MIIISNQILIDFLRLNNRALNVRNEQLGRQLNEIVIQLGGTQRYEIHCGRDNEKSQPLEFPKTSMSYNFPQNQLQNLYNNILNSIL
ncbi:MAG: hypothetical protein QM751_05925 [Paludibacteraceae bacterium]